MGYSSATSEPSAGDNPNRAFLLYFLGCQSDRNIQNHLQDLALCWMFQLIENKSRWWWWWGWGGRSSADGAGTTAEQPVRVHHTLSHFSLIRVQRSLEPSIRVFSCFNRQESGWTRIINTHIHACFIQRYRSWKFWTHTGAERDIATIQPHRVQALFHPEEAFLLPSQDLHKQNGCTSLWHRSSTN